MANRQSRSYISSRTENTIGTSGKKIAAAKRHFNREKYATLLVRAVPRVISNDTELERATRLIEPLLSRAKLTPEEDAFVNLMLNLIEDYQRAHPRISRLAPHEALRYLMEENGLRQADLVSIFGARSRVSNAVNGVREISKNQAKALAEFFQVSPELFI